MFLSLSRNVFENRLPCPQNSESQLTVNRKLVLHNNKMATSSSTDTSPDGLHQPLAERFMVEHIHIWLCEAWPLLESGFCSSNYSQRSGHQIRWSSMHSQLWNGPMHDIYIERENMDASITMHIGATVSARRNCFCLEFSQLGFLYQAHNNYYTCAL